LFENDLPQRSKKKNHHENTKKFVLHHEEHEGHEEVKIEEINTKVRKHEKGNFSRSLGKILLCRLILIHTSVAMVTIGFVSIFSEQQNIEQGISNVEVTPS